MELIKLLLLGGLAVLVVYMLVTRRAKKSSYGTNWPVLGVLPALLLNVHRLHEFITEVLIEAGGTFVFMGPWFCGVDFLLTSDPANIQYIFSKNFRNYPKGPEFRKIFDIMGDGIFNADFELWENLRKATVALLNHADFNPTLEKNIWSKVEIGLLPVLNDFAERGAELDMEDILHRFTFDNGCQIVLGFDPKSLSLELPHIPCEKAFALALEPLLYRHVLPEFVWKLQKWLNIGREKTLFEASKDWDAFIYPRIDHTGDDVQFLPAFRKIYDENISSRSLRDFMKDTALNLLFAARDTTSNGLTWFFYLIAQHPWTQEKIVKEIVTQLNLDGKWRPFSVEESSKLVYLHGALLETLRLYPPAALEHKAPVQGDTLPTGHLVPRNGKVIVSFYTMGRMENLWGKDCLEFKPERWMTARGGIKHEPSYKFPAFNVGPRTCPGKEMAFIQMKMIAATIIYHYYIELVEGFTVKTRNAVLLQTEEGVRVKLFKRAETMSF